MNIKYFYHRYNDWRERRRQGLLLEKQQILFDMDKPKNIIILSSDCVGGRIMKDYALPCHTPTVNIWYSGIDFMKLCEDPLKYFDMEIEEGGFDDEGHPTGRLGDIVLHFGHEDSFEAGARKWMRGTRSFRKAVQSPHEICVIFNDRNGFTEDLVGRFENLPYSHKVLFTHKPHHNAPHTFYMDGEDRLEFVRTMTLFEGLLPIRRRYERFDFYQWFYGIYSEGMK